MFRRGGNYVATNGACDAASREEGGGARDRLRRGRESLAGDAVGAKRSVPPDRIGGLLKERDPLDECLDRRPWRTAAQGLRAAPSGRRGVRTNLEPEEEGNMQGTPSFARSNRTGDPTQV